MSDYILVIADDEGVAAGVREAFPETEVVSVNSFLNARQALVEKKSVLVISQITLADATSGLEFCEELFEHPDLVSIPRFLIDTQADGTAEVDLEQYGIEGVIPWPISLELLEGLLSPSLFSSSIDLAAAPSEEEFEIEIDFDGEEEATVLFSSPEEEDNFEYAKDLLAQVLFNLKKGDLLSILERSQVPDTVLEMTKNVCEASGPESELEDLDS